MEARFRIRKADGRVLEPKTVDLFGELVRSGVVRPEDEIYDALTGTWVPARRHPMVALFQDPLASGEEQSPPASRPADSTVSPSAEDPSALAEPPVLDLVDQPPESPEEAQRAFIEQMELERRSEGEDHPASRDLPIVSADTANVSSARSVESRMRRDAVRRPATAPPIPDPEAEAAGLEPAFPGVPPRRATHRARTRNWKLGAAALMAVLPVAIVVVAAREARSGAASPDESATPPPPSEARADRPVPRTEAQIRDAAYDGFVAGVGELQAELGVGEVPKAWLEGYYLADPTRYPEVRAYWRRYLTLVERTETRETALYRESYLDAAGRAGLSGPVRSLRLAAAAGDFEAGRGSREQFYAHVRELATASLSLDDLCTSLAGRISYEPIRGGRVSADPVIEAAGTDPEAQSQLEQALDRVLTALHGPDGGGAQDRAQIPGWLVDGLKGLK